MWKQKLEEWGLSTFVTNFEDEGIDDDSFGLLDEATVTNLITKTGPRLIFQNKFKQYLNQLNATECKTIECFDTISLDSAMNTNSTYSYEPDEELTSLFNESISTPQPQLEPSCSHIDKKKKFDSVFPDGLENTLQKYTDGLIVLLNKDKLWDDHRKKLSKVIINELFAIYGTSLKESLFLKASLEIENFFPNEKAESYFIPYKPGQQKDSSLNSASEKVRGTNPRGKLWHRYINVKAALRTANSQKKNVTPKKNDTPEKDENVEANLNFLKYALEPPARLFEAWESTYRMRRNLFLNKDLSEIFDAFPCLKLNIGIELIESDFNRKHPNKIDAIYSMWPKISDAIIAETKERKIVISDLDKSSDNGTSALLALAYLFAPITLKKSRKGISWRPTRSEVQESFCMHVLTFGDLEEKIVYRREKLSTYNVTLQPVGAIVGPLENPEGFYIIVNDIKYKVASSIRMLELLYKLFHSLDISYPIECEHIWIFIAEIIYEMKGTKTSSPAASVMADIRYHLDKKEP